MAASLLSQYYLYDFGSTRLDVCYLYASHFSNAQAQMIDNNSKGNSGVALCLRIGAIHAVT